jgi:hypothetical protein
MKRILAGMTLALSVLMFSSAKNSASAQPGIEAGISYQTFYDELSPYGQWMDYPEHGYVWLPNLDPDFQPYRTGGHWVWSDDYDWMWVSDYSWGWAPFHYGRWFYDSHYGWMWVPGYEWSPAWVSWRTGGDYYGWAPLRPGISISFGFGNYDPPYNYWSFAPRRYINSHSIGSYCVDRGRNVTIINNTTIINNYGSRKNVFISGGPRRYDAEKYTGRIRSVDFRETSRPGEREFRNNQVRLYRPQIRPDNNRNIAPRKFDRYQNSNSNDGNIVRRNSNNLPNRTFGDRSEDTNREIAMISLIDAGKFLIVIRITEKRVKSIIRRLSNRRQLKRILVMFLKGTEILNAPTTDNSRPITEQNGGIFSTGTATGRNKTVREIPGRLKGEKKQTIPFHEIKNAGK